MRKWKAENGNKLLFDFTDRFGEMPCTTVSKVWVKHMSKNGDIDITYKLVVPSLSTLVRTI